MSEQLREALSAAMDDEADAFELRRVLDEAEADPELRDQWHRFQMVRDVLADSEFFDGRELRQDLLASMQSDEGENLDISAIVDVDEDVGESKPKVNWLGRVTGTAVAAAVAGLVVLGANQLQQGDSNPPAIADAQSTSTTQPTLAATTVMYPQATPKDRLRLDGLRMHHYQQTALNNAGAVSFVRIATFKKSKDNKAKEQKQSQPDQK